jgi:uncharacterized protein (PEP-CTERM system associated)
MAMAMRGTEHAHRKFNTKQASFWVGLALGGLLSSSSCFAQKSPLTGLALPGMGAGAMAVPTQELAPGQSFLGAGLRGTALYSDNLNLNQNNKTSGGLIEAAPWVAYQNVTTRGRVDLQGMLRLQSTEGSGLRLRSDLSARSDLEVLPSGLRVSARAVTRTINPDPFGSSSTDPAAQRSNIGTLKVFEVSPYAVGDLAGDGGWTLRYRLRHIDLGDAASRAVLGSNVSQQFLGSLRTDLSQRRYAASIDSQARQVGYQNARDVGNESLDVQAWMRASTSLRLGAGLGWAHHDLLKNAAGESSGIGPIASIDWQPTARTSLTGRWASRFYGDQISAEIEHWHTHWRLGMAYRKGVTDGNSASLGTHFLDSPRDLPPPDTDLEFSGVLASPVVYREHLRINAQLQGARTQIRLSAFLNERTSATPLAAGLAADLSQTGLILQGRYQLDGIHTLSLVARHVVTESSSLASQSKLSSLIGAWNVRLSPLWGLTAGTRLQQQSGQGTVAEFDEVAVFLATDYRFR